MNFLHKPIQAFCFYGQTDAVTCGKVNVCFYIVANVNFYFDGDSKECGNFPTGEPKTP